ncbi:MAG: hypothetical protein KH008_04705 [Collinsella sp.]|nr:hypothetical protein [Collinsella sp.]MBS4844177.1 hypothetical protein [Collinsella sp.]
MYAAAHNLRGGVSPRGIRLRGQGIIEYVLIIAVIGLVIVFAGPGVTGAIRNQFNLVGNTENSGANAGTEGGGASGGGSTGSDSASVQAAVAKDAEDWTLDEQKAVAEDIAKSGTSSIAYAKAKAAMDTGTKFSMKLTDGQTLEYRIIGINHDDLADGSGKAGLTFLTTSTDIESRMNPTRSTDGVWEKSELRAKMNSGKIWNLMPADFQSKVKTVTKLMNNINGYYTGSDVIPTSDKLFLLSNTEILAEKDECKKDPWFCSEGAQYEPFRGKVSYHLWANFAIANGKSWWMRSAYPASPQSGITDVYTSVDAVGSWGNDSDARNARSVCPVFCF